MKTEDEKERSENVANSIHKDLTLYSELLGSIVMAICDYRGMEGGDRVDWCDRASCVVTEVSDTIYKKLVAEEIEVKDLLDMIIDTHRLDEET